METLLKRKGLWKYTKVVIPYPTYASTKIFIDGKKDEAIGIITTYISWDIHFHISGIEFPHWFWNKLKSLLDRVDESHFMQLEKELISLDPHSFDKIEDYLAHVKEL